MSRLYVVEPRLTVTGMAADERLPIRDAGSKGLPPTSSAEIGALRGGSDTRAIRTAPSPWVRARGTRPRRARRGEPRPRRRRSATGGSRARPCRERNARQRRQYGQRTAPPGLRGRGGLARASKALVPDIDAGQVATLVVSAVTRSTRRRATSISLRRLAPIPSTAYVGLRDTRRRARAPGLREAHWLEAWSDALAFDGTPAIAQPLIRPSGRRSQPPGRSLRPPGTARRVHRTSSCDHWRTRTPGGFDDFWRESLVMESCPRQTAPRTCRWTGSAIARLLGASRGPQRRSRSPSSPTPRCTTAVSATTPGSRSSPTR